MNHLVYGLTPPGGFDVRRDGQAIEQGLQSSAIGSLAFAVDGGGSFEILSTDPSNPPPAPATDLSAGSATLTGITLTWTALGADGSVGQASVYDIRYATAAITTLNWNAAVQVQGESAPKPAGQAESFTVGNLTAGTVYYFALKIGDEIPYWSGLSNVASATTLPPPDATPPAAVTNLAGGSPSQTSILLTWTAVGDDGASGRAALYDIRYAAAPITGASWGSAAQVQGEPPPKTAGQLESLAISGLTAGTTYYFALKTADEIPNWSAMSNVPSATTLPPPDTTAPAAVTNLAAGSPTTDGIRLTWTAVGDDGLTGRAAAYDIRYAASAITDATWGSAAQVANEPAPAMTGQAQVYTVAGLAPGVVYHFAMKVGDEVPNWGAISNSASAATLPPDAIPPGSVTTLETESSTPSAITLAWIAVGDDGSSGQASVYDLRHSTSPITAENWGSATQVAGEPSPKPPGQAESFSLGDLLPDERYFFALKVRDEAMNWSELSNIATVKTLPAPDTAPPQPIVDHRAGGLGHRSIEVIWTAPSDDSLSERVTSYEGRYTTGPLTASSWSTATPISGLPDPALPGETDRILLGGLAPATAYTIGIRARDEIGHLADLGTVLGVGTTSAPDTIPPDRVVDLSVVGRTISSITISWHAPSDNVPDDCVDTPEVSRYEIRFATTSLADGGWDAGTPIAGPPPESPGMPQELTISGLAPATRYFIALRSCDPRDQCSETSNQVEHATADPEPLPDTDPPGPPANLVAAAQDTQSIRLAWIAPGGDGGQGKADHYDIRRFAQPLTLETWDEAILVTVDKPCGDAGSAESHLVDHLSPATVYHFALRAIDAAGNLGQISASVSDTTSAPPDPIDRTPPGAVADLRAADADTGSVLLEWTTPGDDRGPCASYELRFSKTPIDSAVWEGATVAGDTPSPGSPGSSVSHRVSGLSSATTYYFALRAFDDAGNPSPISNVVSAETDTIHAPPDTTPPPAVTDLEATPLGSTQILLTWTAVEDLGPSGAAASYEVRLSPAPIDSANWSQAAVVPVPFDPGAPRSIESLTVSGLLPATAYHFAVRVRDLAGNLSACSPDASSVTSPILDTNPPAAPMGLEAASGEDHVHLTWYPSPEPDVVSYTIFRRAAEGSGIEPLSVPGLAAPAFEDTTAAPEIDFYYSIAALDGSGNLSSPSAEIHVRLSLAGFLPQVSDFSAQATVSAIGPGRRSLVRLSWQATIGGRFREFAVDRSTDNGDTWIRRAAGWFGAKTGYEFEEEVARGTYLYRIAAISPLNYELLFEPLTVRANGKPVKHQISGPFPNPSSGPLQFTITLADDVRVRILAYDLQGRLCGILHDATESVGEHPWSYDPQMLREGPLASGVYFLRITVDEEQLVRKFVLEK